MDRRTLLAQLGSARNLDDVGWASLHAHVDGIDPAAVLAVIDGTAPTTSLPVAVACAAVRRLGARDVASAAAASEGDRRSKVTATLRECTEPVSPLALPADAPLEAIAATFGRFCVTEGIGERPFRQVGEPVAKFATGLFAPPGVVAEFFCAALARTIPLPVPPDDHTISDLTAVATTLLDYASADQVAEVAARIPSMSDDVATATVCALALLDHSLSDVVAPTLPAATLRAALTRSAEIHGRFWGRAGAVDAEKLSEAVAAWLHRDGMPLRGPGSAAELFGCPDSVDDCTYAELELLYQVASKRPESRLELLCDITHGGARARSVPGFHLHSAPAGLPAAVAFAALSQPNSSFEAGLQSQAVTESISGKTGQRWDRTEAEAALEVRPELAAALWEWLPEATRDGNAREVPEWLIEASMRAVGLARWLPIPRVADALAAAAAGATVQQWEAMVALIGEFRGTPADLVAISETIAPTAA